MLIKIYAMACRYCGWTVDNICGAACQRFSGPTSTLEGLCCFYFFFFFFFFFLQELILEGQEARNPATILVRNCANE